jgi:aryl-alcohol dehydrogenase-like predicted oxidoreductase
MTLRPDPYRHLLTGETFKTIENLEGTAHRRGISLATLSLAWALSEPTVSAIVIGPRRPAQLEPALTALDVALTGEERAELDALVGSVMPRPETS